MRLVPNPGAARLLQYDPRVIAVLDRVARAVATEAKRLSPSQRYNENIEVDSGVDERGEIVARVNAMHWTSWFIEAGTLHQAASAPLRRALESGTARRVL